MVHISCSYFTLPPVKLRHEPITAGGSTSDGPLLARAKALNPFRSPLFPLRACSLCTSPFLRHRLLKISFFRCSPFPIIAPCKSSPDAAVKAYIGGALVIRYTVPELKTDVNFLCMCGHGLTWLSFGCSSGGRFQL